jgi:hypothetical protein
VTFSSPFSRRMKFPDRKISSWLEATVTDHEQ